MLAISRICCRCSGYPRAIRWSVLAFLLYTPYLSAQIVDPAQSDPLAPMPDIGIEWPDLDTPDTIQPLVPDPLNSVQSNEPVNSEPLPELATETVQPLFSGDGQERRYTLQLTGIETFSDETFLNRFNQLSVLRQGQDKPANLAQINRRITEDDILLDRLLRAKGYYAARVRGAIAAPPAGSDRLAVNLDVIAGTQYILQSVELPGVNEAGFRAPNLLEAFPVKVGDPIDADKILAGRESLELALAEGGFPFAKVAEPDVRIDHEERKGDLAMVVEPGGYRSFGSIRLENDKLFSARHLQRIARFRPNDPYKASEVEDLRRAIVATGLVSTVTLKPVDADDGEHVDLDVGLRAAPLRTIAGELGYGTGEGYRAEVSWQHRNFFPPEGGITAKAVLGTQEQSASLLYRRNNFKARDHVLTGLISYSDIQRNAYDARTINLSGTLEQQTNILFRKKWIWSVGGELIASDEADYFSGGARRTFFIGALPVSLTYDGSDDLLNPSKGFRLGGQFSPELSFQNGTFGYARVQVDGSIYQPISDRVVIAGRTRLGTILGSTVDRIAPSRRFYAGGGASVRGYGYQKVGPRYGPDDDPVGGKSLTEFSLEARVRFGNFGVVPFVDAGNISTSFLPRFHDLRIGAGVGVRYYTSFGPIRFDVGTPVNPQPGDPKIAVYVSLGQAF